MKRGTPDHPKTVMLAMELEKVYAAHRKRNSFGGKSEAVGLLEVLWDWCSKYAIQGDLGKWPDDVIASGIGWIWSGKELIDALIQSRWIDKAPAPYRLVIHDIKDHATNSWRQNLERAGLTWWDGSDPRKYKLQQISSETPLKRGNDSIGSDSGTDKDTDTAKEDADPEGFITELRLMWPKERRVTVDLIGAALVDLLGVHPLTEERIALILENAREYTASDEVRRGVCQRVDRWLKGGTALEPRTKQTIPAPAFDVQAYLKSMREGN